MIRLTDARITGILADLLVRFFHQLPEPPWQYQRDKYFYHFALKLQETLENRGQTTVFSYSSIEKN